MVLGGCLVNADSKGYRAGVAARIGGIVRLDEGQGSGFTGSAAIGGQDRGVISQRSTVFFDGVVYRYIVIVVQRGGKGAVDGHLQRIVGGQGDVLAVISAVWVFSLPSATVAGMVTV